MRAWAWIFFFLASFGAGALGGLATGPEFYFSLERPPGAPPASVFGPVWSVLYFLIALVATLIYRSKEPIRKLLLAVWWMQMLLNAAWSPVFFGFEQPNFALAIIGALWIVLVVFAWFVRKHRLWLALWIPYVLWVTFATYLNFGIVVLN